MPMVRAHASIIPLSSLAPNTPCRPLHKGLCAAVFCSFLAPAHPEVQETGLHLSSNYSPFSYQLPSVNSSQLFLVKLKFLNNKGLSAPMLFLLFQLLLPRVWAIPSCAWHQLDFLPLSFSVRPFKHRETALQDQTSSTQTNH